MGRLVSHLAAVANKLRDERRQAAQVDLEDCFKTIEPLLTA